MKKYELVYVEGNQYMLCVDGFEIASIYTYKDCNLEEIKQLITDAEKGRARED